LNCSSNDWMERFKTAAAMATILFRHAINDSCRIPRFTVTDPVAAGPVAPINTWMMPTGQVILRQHRKGAIWLIMFTKTILVIGVGDC
jgi:hypothetical protein